MVMQESITRLCSLDSGKTTVASWVGEVIPTCEKIAWVLRDGEQALVPQARPNGPGIASITKCAWVEYVGAVGADPDWFVVELLLLLPPRPQWRWRCCICCCCRHSLLMPSPPLLRAARGPARAAVVLASVKKKGV